MVTGIRIWSLVCALTLGASAAAHADAIPPASPTPAGNTMIDITGTIMTADLTGGVADPVPLFVGSSGPVFFVMGMPGIGEAGTDVSLRRPGMSFGPMAGVRQPRSR